MVKSKEKKKKVWIKIVAPSEFGNKVLGETVQSGKLVGRTLKISLFNLLGDMKKQSNNLCFVVNDVKDGTAKTEVYRYYVSPSHLKRLVRKNKEKIDDSFIVETKNKIKLKIKPFMLTRKKTSRSRVTALIKLSRDIFTAYAKENTFIGILRDVISFKVQNKLKYGLKKIYPLSLYEIRAIEKIK